MQGAGIEETQAQAPHPETPVPGQDVPQALVLLRRYWQEGMTASQIAERLMWANEGQTITRNAVGTSGETPMGGQWGAYNLGGGSFQSSGSCLQY